MMFRATIVFLALAVPAFAQRGSAHAGSIGGRGFSGPAGFSSHPAFSRPSFSQSPGFARSAPASRYGSFAGYRTYAQPGLRSPYYGNRFAARRPSYDPRGIGVSRSFDRDRGRNPDRDRFDRRRREFQNWVVNTYAYWPGYPYLYDPNAYNLALYDWDEIPMRPLPTTLSLEVTSQKATHPAATYLTRTARLCFTRHIRTRAMPRRLQKLAPQRRPYPACLSP